jgi:hypothetical protein
MKDADAILLCDNYPINIDHKGIAEKGRQFDVSIEVLPEVKEFYRIPLNQAGYLNSRISYRFCRGGDSCATLRNSRIYPCSHIAFVDILQNKFGLPELTPTSDDFTDIYGIKDGDEILKQLLHPVPWCKHCDTEHCTTFAWDYSKKEKSEWVDVVGEAQGR